ncbi:MAG: class I SAM-dependent methyltransferase [Dechloromonas sp.]|nr:class I SAM-dependent methyltransferase [Dechloromonas sp.]
MSGATVSEFLTYWASEGEAYVRRGDYEWMASLVPGQRVLEVGCGLGFGTQALVDRELQVMAIDLLPECLAATAERLAERLPDVRQCDVTALTAADRQALRDFAPDSVVCWLMGAPADTTGASSSDAGKAVAVYREAIHRAVAELAAQLPSVQALHLVDRTAIPWQAKDIGRDTLLSYHHGKTLHGLPWQAERRNALYRKLEDKVVNLAHLRKSHPALKSVVPTLASLLAHRSK